MKFVENKCDEGMSLFWLRLYTAKLTHIISFWMISTEQAVEIYNLGVVESCDVIWFHFIGI